MEAIIESGDEFYNECLAQGVTGGCERRRLGLLPRLGGRQTVLEPAKMRGPSGHLEHDLVKQPLPLVGEAVVERS